MPPRKPTYTTAKATGGMTYHEIAAVMGVSHTRIQQIEGWLPEALTYYRPAR